MLPDTVENMPVAYPHTLLTVHIRQHESNHTLCGQATSLYQILAKKSAVTCDDCISAWVRSKHSYEEVT